MTSTSMPITSSFLKEYGPRLLQDGYSIVPIKPGFKYPKGLEAWEKTQATPRHLQAWLSDGFSQGGVGILTKHTPAIDLDIHDPEIVEHLVSWCYVHFGKTLCRVGQSPKTLLVYRTETPFPKVTSKNYFDQEKRRNRIEILGDGQQFVAFAIHPDTQKPYEWVGGLNLADVPHDFLPGLSHAQAKSLVAYFETLVPEHWTTTALKPSKTPKAKTLAEEPILDFQGFENIRPKLDRSKEQIEGYLSDIVGLCDDYETWITIGMALYHQFDGNGTGYRLWNAWSQNSFKYQAHEMPAKWASFKVHLLDRKGLTCATLVKMAREQRHGVHLKAGKVTPSSNPENTALNLELSHYDLTDGGNVNRFCARFGREFLVCQERGFLFWDEKKWALDKTEGHVKQAIKKTIACIKQEAHALSHSLEDYVVKETKKGDCTLRSDSVASWALSSQSSAQMSAVLKHARDEIERPMAEFDKDPFKFNAANGTLRFCKGALGEKPKLLFSPHDRNDLLTKLSPVEYDPEAICPTYDAFLEEVQPNPDVRRFLHQWGGLSLTGDISEQKLAFFYGKGKNGKSTLIDIWAHVAGEYGDTVPIETFLNQGKSRNAGAASPDLATLPGVRFLRTSEPERGAKLAESLIKSITGGEALSVRQIYQKAFCFTPQFKLTISGNYRPRIDGTDEGIWRRLMLVPWEITITESKRDPYLASKLKSEASGILNRLLQGVLEWMEHGLIIPESIQETTKEFRATSDPLGQFLEVCTRQTRGARVSSGELYRVFLAWCRASGETEWTATRFGRTLRERGFLSKNCPQVWWLGVELTKKERDFSEYEEVFC